MTAPAALLFAQCLMNATRKPTSPTSTIVSQEEAHIP